MNLWETCVIERESEPVLGERRSDTRRFCNDSAGRDPSIVESTVPVLVAVVPVRTTGQLYHISDYCTIFC